ncbi:MAG: pilus assembly protein PilM [Anaerotignum sp.]|nr:pilus assembly protein PilM [Anaerotignum sp.]
MASKMIGIDIGGNTMKMTVCAGGTVKKAAVSPMPEYLTQDGHIAAPDAMSDFIKKMLKENGIRRGDCAMVLPRQIVIATRLSMPVMSEKELLLNLPFEFRDFVGKDTNNYDYDYVVCGVEDNMMDIYAAAVRKELVEEYYSIFKKAGLTLKLAMPAEIAWTNLIRRAKDVPGKICIVDIGHHVTRVNIFSGDNFIMGRSIEMAGSTINENIAYEQNVDSFAAHTRKEANAEGVLNADFLQETYDTLAMQIANILQFFGYSDTSEGGPLEHVYYCGGSSLIEPLRTALHENTGMTLHHINDLLKMNEEDKDLALFCSLAASAAMQK